MFGIELFILFTVRVFHERLSIGVCVSVPSCFDGGKWDLIVLIPDHCFSFYFTFICFKYFLFLESRFKQQKSF